MLKMQDVSKVYRTDLIETYALRNFSLEVSAGEFVAVTGPSETSSYQSSLAQKYPSRAVPAGEADLPKPPSTTR